MMAIKHRSLFQWLGGSWAQGTECLLFFLWQQSFLMFESILCISIWESANNVQKSVTLTACWGILVTDLSDACVRAGRTVVQKRNWRKQRIKTLLQAQIPGRRDKGNFTKRHSVQNKQLSTVNEASTCETPKTFPRKNQMCIGPQGYRSYSFVLALAPFVKIYQQQLSSFF